MRAIDQASQVANKVSGNFDNFGKKMMSMGSQLNVLGQRMTWMVSVPLLAFANSSVDTAVEIERSWTRFRKVFNGTEDDIKNLMGVATELSNKFGRPIEEINGIMAEFNKAGIDSSKELEKLASIVSETAIIFDTELQTALDGTKSVMMGFNLTAMETEKALAAINIIADKTTASEEGILDVFNRAAGTARQAGFSFRELASSQSVFEKNAIPAGRAGNAMKSILTSLTKQSQKAKDQFKVLGVDMESTAWRTSNAGDKLNILAKTLLQVKQSGDKLKLADLNEAMASLVGKFQINNLNVLLEDLSYEFDNNAQTISQFNEGLRVSADETENLKFKNEQLKKVLESSPQKLDTLNQIYRNQQSILGNQLLPYKLKLLETISKLIDGFNKLSPETQKWVLYLTGAVVVLGPLLAGLGLLMTGLGSLGTIIVSVSSAVGSVGSAIGLVGGLWALVAVLAIISTIMIVKAIKSFKELNSQIEESNKWLQQNNKTLDVFQQKVGSLSTQKSNDQLQNAINKSREMDKALQDLNNRYSGFGGVLRSVGDQFAEWGNKAVNALKKVWGWLKEKGLNAGSAISKMLGFANGGIVNGYANGGLVYAANGFLARGKDTVPAMLSPGEMVLNKSQQSTLFDLLSGRSQMQSAGGPVININVGTMVASRGEQREFARKIQELLTEDNKRK